MAGGGSNFADDGDGAALISDINVTPLVDITLVLLIIMMVAAPIIANNPSIKVDLPKASTGDETQKTTLAFTLAKKPDGSAGYDLYLNGEKVDEAKAQRVVTELLSQKKEIQAVIAGDKGIAYGDVMHIIDLVKSLGITKFAMSTDGT
jgi:biopolymer transport protein TolR